MRFRLRTLLIVLAVGPVALWWSYGTIQQWKRERAIEALNRLSSNEVQSPRP